MEKEMQVVSYKDYIHRRTIHPLIINIDDVVINTACSTERLKPLAGKFQSVIGDFILAIQWPETQLADEVMNKEISSNTLFNQYFKASDNKFLQITNLYRILIVARPQTESLELWQPDKEPYIYTPQVDDPTEFIHRVALSIENNPFVAEMHAEGPNSGFIHYFQRLRDIIDIVNRQNNERYPASLLD